MRVAAVSSQSGTRMALAWKGRQRFKEHEITSRFCIVRRTDEIIKPLTDPVTRNVLHYGQVAHSRAAVLSAGVRVTKDLSTLPTCPFFPIRATTLNYCRLSASKIGSMCSTKISTSRRRSTRACEPVVVCCWLVVVVAVPLQ